MAYPDVHQSDRQITRRSGLCAFSSRVPYPTASERLSPSTLSCLQIAVWTGDRGCTEIPDWRDVAPQRHVAIAWAPGPPLRSDSSGEAPHVGLILDGKTLNEMALGQGETFLETLKAGGGKRIVRADAGIMLTAFALERLLVSPGQSPLLREAKTIELLARVVEGEPTPTASWTREERDRLDHAREILLHDLAAPPTIAGLARMCGLNTMKLKRDFKRRFGLPIYAYHRQERLRHALVLLETTDRSVTQVAYDIGYTNLGHFSAVFRAEFGLLPRDVARDRKSF